MNDINFLLVYTASAFSLQMALLPNLALVTRKLEMPAGLMVEPGKGSLQLGTERTDTCTLASVWGFGSLWFVILLYIGALQWQVGNPGEMRSEFLPWMWTWAFMSSVFGGIGAIFWFKHYREIELRKFQMQVCRYDPKE